MSAQSEYWRRFTKRLIGQLSCLRNFVTPLGKAKYEGHESVPQVTRFTSSILKHGADAYSSVIVGPTTLLPAIVGGGPLRGVLSTLEHLEPDDYVRYTMAYYNEGLQHFGNDWYYADIVTVLLGLAQMMQPESYLEIGVRRGRSMAMVASQSPNCRILGFDMWIHDYSGLPNPGPDFVRSELAKTGYQGSTEFVNGNSHSTVKAFFREHPDTFFDLITVDGDHSRLGAAQDIVDVLPHLKIGGIIVFDDIAHPKHPELLPVWRKLVASDPRFSTWEFTDLGYGVAFGIRKW